MASPRNLGVVAQAPVPKRLASLIVAYSRAKVLRSEWQKEHRKVLRKISRLEPGVDLAMSDMGRWLTFYSLWLSCLEVVVEGYDRSHRYPDSLLTDGVIDGLLTKSRRARLKRFRNTILHPELYDHPDNASVMQQYAAFAEWAGRLTDEFGRLLVENLGGHSPGPG